MGLIRRTRCLFVSEAFGGEKPNPAIFLAAAQCLGAEPAQTLFAGDHPVNDIVGAQKAAMQTAWLPRGKPCPPQCCPAAPDWTLGSLLDVPSPL